MESRAEVRKRLLKGQSLRAVWALGAFLLALFAEPLHHLSVRHHLGSEGELLHCEGHDHCDEQAPVAHAEVLDHDACQHEHEDLRWSPEDECADHEACGLRFEARVDRAPSFDPLTVARPVDSTPVLPPRAEPRAHGPDRFRLAPKNSPPRRTV